LESNPLTKQQDGVYCGSLEKLDLALTRAGRHPLDLTVEWPMKQGLLSLISTRNNRIDSLSLAERCRISGMPEVDVHTCNGLNLTTLRTLSFDIDLEKVPSFMNLALQSTLSQFCLKFRNNYPDEDVLEHELMKRVSCIRIESSQSTIALEMTVIDHYIGVHYADESLGGIPLLPYPTLLPNVKRWELHGEPDLVYGFDLSCAESLELAFGRWGTDIMKVPIPRNLTELYLASVFLTEETIRKMGRYRLPNLTTLRMFDTAVEGTLDDYFEVPKLRILHLESVFGCALAEDTDKPEPENYSLTSRVLGPSFFTGAPGLESLVLRKMTMTHNFTRAFGVCAHLKELVLENCNIKLFLTSCVIDIADKGYLPSLSSLKISGSWPVQSNVSYTDLMKHCRTQRPGLLAYGNADTYNHPFGDDEEDEEEEEDGDEDGTHSSSESESGFNSCPGADSIIDCTGNTNQSSNLDSDSDSNP
jgi:hypothetical protein